MASVFLSYDRDDAAKARPIALQLERAGHNVWWDLHVRGGAQFSKVIEEALTASEVVVVLWSVNSIESPWVRDEAAAGRDSGRLVPVKIDGTDPPLGFRQFQTIDMSRWTGRGKSPQLRTLLADIETTASASSPAPPQEASAPLAPSSRPVKFQRRSMLLAGGAALILIIAGGVYWKLAPRSGGQPIVSVAAADNSSLSQSMTHNMMVNLGSIAGNITTDFRLMDDQSPVRPDFRLSIGGTEQGGKAQATIALLSGGQGGVLWSRQLEQPAGQRATLEQAAALAAMAALTCGSSPGARQLGSNDLRAFIGACVSLDEGADAQPLAAVFRRATQAAPKFAGAWAKLLIAETQMLWDEDGDAVRPTLRRDVEAARKVDPSMPEIAVAEADLLPPTSFLRAIATLDAAKAAHANDPEVLSARADHLARVGRLGDALADDEQAVAVKPFSPALRMNYLVTLAATGGIAKVWDGLAEAKRLWPDAPVVTQVDQSINMRYGDFEKTWRAAGLPIDGGITGYFKILHDPSDANIDAWINLARTHKLQRGHHYFILQALGPLNRVDQLYQFLDQWPVEQEFQAVTQTLFRPWLAKIRRDPRFMRLAQRLGLLDYWEKSGNWPDFCAEPDMPYDCKKEAAKLHA